jgi:hypothetical protein
MVEIMLEYIKRSPWTGSIANNEDELLKIDGCTKIEAQGHGRQKQAKMEAILGNHGRPHFSVSGPCRRNFWKHICK